MRPLRLDVPAQRIVVTAGGRRAALQLSCLACDRDDEVLLPDPSYPCNRHFVSAAEGRRCCCRRRRKSAFS
jgi:aspartate/methionine/tyrosine aminotransferase